MTASYPTPDTDPRLAPRGPFHGMSYLLFTTVTEPWQGVAARLPARPALGEPLPLPRFSAEAMAYMNTAEERPPLFVLTDWGLGLLHPAYHRHAGLWLYLHIHCRPEAGARLLMGGALGDPVGGGFRVESTLRLLGAAGSVTRRDQPSYEVLAEAWSRVIHSPTRLTPAPEGTVTVENLETVLTELAAFSGCGLTVEAERAIHPAAEGQPAATVPLRRVACYRPRLLEAILLCLLTEGRELAEPRSLRVTVGAVGHREGGPLSMTLRYIPLSPTPTPSSPAGHRHLTAAAEVNGLCLRFVKEGEERVAYLDWVADPACLPTSDLKAPLPPTEHTPEPEW